MRAASWVLMLLCGCGRPTPNSAGDTGAVYPHGPDYIRQHPDDALREAERCLRCHLGERPADTARPVAPPCTACHDWPLDTSQARR